MSKQTLRNIVVLMALCVLAIGMASANSVTKLTGLYAPSINAVTTTNIAFPSAGNSYFTTVYGAGTILPGGQTDPMWTAGDYVQSASFMLHNGPIVGVSADWTYQNFLGNGNTETWYLYINATPVAFFVAPDDAYNGDIFNVTGSVSFAPYTVPLASSYTLTLVLQNTVPFGGGSILFNDGGITGVTTVPEPGTLVLLGSSLLGFAGIVRRKLIG